MKNITTAEILQNAQNLAPLESQKEYRRKISEFLRMHNARVAALDSGISHSALPVNSMLIIAQTGCGKTYTATRLAEAAGVDLITVDCSSLTLSGYKGCNLGDLLYSAYMSAKEQSRFERSVILFDEFDKIRIDGQLGNPQPNFLKLFDGFIPADPKNQTPVTIDVSRMSFLFAGAFAGLEEIILDRLQPRRGIGFCSNDTGEDLSGDLLAKATLGDVQQYGFMQELLGRIGSLCYIPPLTVTDYRILLKGNSGSIAGKYNNLLSPSGVTLDITDSACAHIAAEASRHPLGARAADPIIYNSLSSAFTKLDADSSIDRVTISCRGNKLALQYHRSADGNRQKEESNAEQAKKELTAPDVSIADYLVDEEHIEELLDLALEIFDRPGTTEEQLFRSFLHCALLIMSKLHHKSDLILLSLTKLAIATEKVNPDKTSPFDRIVEEKITRHKGEEFGILLQDVYTEFRELEDGRTTDFLVYATKLLRQNWYQNLLNAACA